MDYSKDEIAAIAGAHFRGELARCPRCGGRVEIEQVPVMSGARPHLNLSCQRCGAVGQRDPRNEPSAREWTPQEKDLIEQTWYSKRFTRCPADGATVLARRDPLYRGLGEWIFSAHCPDCGNSFTETRAPLTPVGN